jgi:hypothetical protein
MRRTLKAVVRGDRIEWLEASEQSFPAAKPVEALIIPLHEQPASSPQERVARRLAALKELAAINACSGIEDPREWQRQIREDRDLPDRSS